MTKRMLLAAMAVVAFGMALPLAAQELKKIRIGWQPTTTVEAQIAHAMAKTNILELNGLQGEMIMFSFGPAVNEALVGGSIDVGFIGDMPSVSLAVANAPTTVVGRQSVFRGSILATPKSGVNELKDLRGKKLYGPVGSSIYLASIGMLEKAGLKAGKDVEMVHMGFADLSDAIKGGKVDAVFVWDPWIELFVTQGLAKELAKDTNLTMVIAMRNDYMQKNPEVTEKFLRAHKAALLFAASDHRRANAWFREPENARTLDPAIIQTATAYDPQWSAKAMRDIRISFNDAEMDRYLGLGRQAFALKVFPKEPPLKEKTDMSVAKRLDAASWDFDLSKVKVK